MDSSKAGETNLELDSLRDSFTANVSVLSDLIAASLESQLVRDGLGFSAFELLSAVEGAGGSATQAEVARRLGITAASLSEAVKSASAKGLVVQSDMRSDRRAKRLRLSAAGRKVLRGALRELWRIESSMLEGLDEARVQEAIDVIRSASRNLVAESPE